MLQGKVKGRVVEKRECGSLWLKHCLTCSFGSKNSNKASWLKKGSSLFPDQKKLITIRSQGVMAPCPPPSRDLVTNPCGRWKADGEHVTSDYTDSDRKQSLSLIINPGQQSNRTHTAPELQVTAERNSSGMLSLRLKAEI